MSARKQMQKIINGAEPHEFSQIVKSYIKSYINADLIIDTDGPGDLGNDFAFFKLYDQKIQCQATTYLDQKLKKKITDDISKAKRNVETYKYSDKYWYFVSSNLQPETIQEYKKLALLSGINLELIDANHLAQSAEQYLELQQIIYEISELDKFQLKNELFTDDNRNLIFDLVSLGNPSRIKREIFEAFIIHSIYNDVHLDLKTLIEKCKNHFSSNIDESFVRNLLNDLRGAKRVEYFEGKKDEFNLSEMEIERIKVLKSNYILSEKAFLKEIQDVLNTYGISSDDISLIIQKLKVLFEENFAIDISEIIKKDQEIDLADISRDFKTFMQKFFPDEHELIKVVKTLFSVCSENSFFQNMCAVKTFTTKINPDRLERYLNQAKKIFIDTPVALYALCYLSSNKSNYENYYYQIVKDLISYCKQNNVKLYINYLYAHEIKNHFDEAYDLVPYTRLKNFIAFGKSKNVFYNFYLNLIQEKLIDSQKKFEDFLNSFNIYKYSNKESFTSNITYLFKALNIEIVTPEKQYDNGDVIKMFDYQLSYTKNRFRTQFAKANDSVMLKYLADNDSSVHPITPIFATWDNIFFKVRERYFNLHKDCQKWLMLTPARLLNQLSMAKLKISPNTVTNDVLSLIDSSFANNTKLLIDSISTILSPDNEVSLQYLNKLAEIREQEIANASDIEEIHTDRLEEETLIDDVIYQFNKYYTDKTTENHIPYLRKIFTMPNEMPHIMNLIEDEIKFFSQKKVLSGSLTTYIDTLIKKMKSAPESYGDR